MRPKSVRVLSVAAALVATATVGAVTGIVAFAALDDSQGAARVVTATGAEPASRASSLDASQIFERSHRGVVEVTASGGTTQFGEPGRQQAQGSGFVYDDQGHVVTNQHVVDGADSFDVRLWDGSTHDARLVGADASTDLAVLEIDAPLSVLQPLRLADSSAVEVGDAVFALGSPFGLEGTLTSGIVSALHRQMRAPNDFTINDSIQTDAAINHGNSGGPLLDSRGRVIGVNAQIESESGGSDGVGFAIPSNTVRSIASRLIASGTVEHAYLGVTIQEVPGGVAVTDVRAGTPAEKAGLRAATGTRTVDGNEVPTGGDVIVAIDGDPVSTSAELQAAIDARRPGDSVRLTIERSGESLQIQVRLASRPS